MQRLRVYSDAPHHRRNPLGAVASHRRQNHLHVCIEQGIARGVGRDDRDRLAVFHARGRIHLARGVHKRARRAITGHNVKRRLDARIEARVGRVLVELQGKRGPGFHESAEIAE